MKEAVETMPAYKPGSDAPVWHFPTTSVAIAAALCLLAALLSCPGAAQAQEFSTTPILLEPDVDLKYLKDNYFLPPNKGKTNWYRIQNSGLQYGDRVRIRTRGTFAVRLPDEDDFGPEEPRSFLGFFTGVVLKPNLYHAAPLEDPGLPDYTTRPILDGGKEFPTDVPRDFLITPEGVTVCLPISGNFLGLLNPDPRASAVDSGGDFRVEITPIEGARVRSGVALSEPEVTVGDSVTLTLSLTNHGNATAFKLAMDPARPRGINVDSNLVVALAGPEPETVASLDPGEQTKFTFSYRAIGPGTNTFRVSAGSVLCGDSFFAGYGGFANLVIQPVIEVTPCHPEEVYAKDSVEAGKEKIDLPLRYTDDEAALAKADKFPNGEWIADGVTPLLLRLEIAPDKLDFYPTGTKLEVKAAVVAGQISGPSIGDRVEVLQDGVWMPNGRASVNKEKPYAFAMVNAVLADELKIAAGYTEVVIKVDIVDSTGLTVGTRRVLIRRPPIVLLHGFNSNGDWGDASQVIPGAASAFEKELVASRGNDLVQIARYGQNMVTGPLSGKGIKANTYLPFEELVMPASIAIEQALQLPRSRWIFTRHDLVGHSQGGVLARMLCARNWGAYLLTSFRDYDNFYRGRFHRVLTIGTPHNGTRLLHYIRQLDKNTNSVVPAIISHQIVKSDAAQEKFDPWGEQIQKINDPGSDASFAVDPGAKIHMVGTLILNGQTFATRDDNALWALGLDRPERGAIVIDEGADGIVDYASMFGKAPGTALPPNGYLVPPVNQIAHAAATAFNATSSQTESTVVARHVIQALDQDPALPAAERTFSSFIMPERLPTSIRQAIDELARVITTSTKKTTATADSSPRVAGTVHASSTVRDFTFRVIEPAGGPITGKSYWIPQIYGTNGVTQSGVQTLPQGADRRMITIRVNPGVYGDVVFEGIYESTNDTRVLVGPVLVASLLPPGVTNESLTVLPSDASRFPPGLSLPVEVWSTWSDGQTSLRFVRSEQVTVISTNPSVVDVSDPLSWKTVVPGEAAITTTFEGRSYTNHWTVYASGTPVAAAPRLEIERASPTKSTLSWPATNQNSILQFTEQIGPGADWQPFGESPIQSGNKFVIDVPSASSTRFYRLKTSP